MKRVDGYLSRKAQTVWPAAIVYCDELAGSKQVWTLEKNLPLQVSCTACGIDYEIRGSIPRLCERCERTDSLAAVDPGAASEVGLGDGFGPAKQALMALMASARASGPPSPPSR